MVDWIIEIVGTFLASSIAISVGVATPFFIMEWYREMMRSHNHYNRMRDIEQMKKIKEISEFDD